MPDFGVFYGCTLRDLNGTFDMKMEDQSSTIYLETKERFHAFVSVILLTYIINIID